MPRQAVYDALPAGHKAVMHDASIVPVINRRRSCCYQCQQCGAVWSERDTFRIGLFWWACPAQCNWARRPELTDVMRVEISRIASEYQAPTRIRSRRFTPPVDVNRLSVEEWSRAVDQLLAEVQQSQGRPPGGPPQPHGQTKPW
jgi:hypothetical protein